MDYPLNNRIWLNNEFDDRNLDTEAEKQAALDVIVNRTAGRAASDDLGQPGAQPHLHPGWAGNWIPSAADPTTRFLHAGLADVVGDLRGDPAGSAAADEYTNRSGRSTP